jgi:hypothetical protein
MDEQSVRLTAKMQELEASGLVIDWKRLEPRAGGRLQVEYLFSLSPTKINEIQTEIALAEGCPTESVSMIPRVAGDDAKITDET